MKRYDIKMVLNRYNMNTIYGYYKGQTIRALISSIGNYVALIETRGKNSDWKEHPDNWPLPGSNKRYSVWDQHIIIPLPKFSHAAESAVLNRGPDHILILKWQVWPLVHSGTEKSIEKGLYGLELGTDASKQLQKLIAENPEQEFAGIIEWSGIKKLGD